MSNDTVASSFLDAIDSLERTIYYRSLKAPYRIRCIAKATEGLTLDIGSNLAAVAGLRKYAMGVYDKTINVDIDIFPVPYFVRAQAEHLPFRDGVFETIVAAEIFEHVDKWEDIYNQIIYLCPLKVIVSVPDSRMMNKRSNYIGTTEYAYKKYENKMKEVRDPVPYAYITDDKLFRHIWHVRETHIGPFMKRFIKDFAYVSFRTTDLKANKEANLLFMDLPYIIFELKYISDDIGSLDIEKAVEAYKNKIVEEKDIEHE